MSFTQRAWHHDYEETDQTGVHLGETRIRLDLIRLKFGEISGDIRWRIEQADADTFRI
jgi:hypothetical protein